MIKGKPRLRSSVGKPGETGVQRPDGRKPESGEGARPGSGECNRKSGRVEREGEKRRHMWAKLHIFGFTVEYATKPGKEWTLPGVRITICVLDGVRGKRNSPR